MESDEETDRVARRIVTLSDDSREMYLSDGELAVTLRSARPGGFTKEDVERAYRYEWPHSIRPGQLNRAWLRHVGDYQVMIQFNTGPPTWWRPRLELTANSTTTNNSVMVGWLRALVAVSVKRDQP